MVLLKKVTTQNYYPVIVAIIKNLKRQLDILLYLQNI